MREKIYFKAKPLTLVGRPATLARKAPDFSCILPDLETISLSHFKDKIKIITSFISLDTPVCDLQVKEFNKRAAEFSSEVAVLGISKDLPFAQRRFCQANDIKNALVCSDYKSSSFGINYGLLIKEMNLLARAVLILDKDNILRYIEIVPEQTTAPDYQAALDFLTEVIKNPAVFTTADLPSKCKPCEEGALALPKEKIDRLLALHYGWQVLEDKKIVKELRFKDFLEAKYFLDLLSIIAEEQGHHPALTLIYNKLKITLTTHAAGGLTENDFIMARIIDELLSN